MKKLMLSVLLILGMAGLAEASGMPSGGDKATPFRITATVYNDSGSDLTSGTVVVWDNDDTEFDRSGHPYVTTTTTADHDWVAGVTLNPTCYAGQMCEIVIYGMAITRIADATDAVTEDTAVATTTVAGEAGDAGGAAQACFLGILPEAYNLDAGADTNSDNSPMWVFVNPTCED